MLPSLKDCKIGVIGLGYVGLPLAAEFAKYYIKNFPKIKKRIIGFDINKERIDELNKNFDRTLEVNQEELKSLKNIIFVNDINRLIDADVFMITPSLIIVPGLITAFAITHTPEPKELNLLTIAFG